MAQQFCTQNYGTVDRLAEAQAFVRKRLSARALWQSPVPLSYSVIGDRRTISRKAGLSVDEIKLASEAAHYIAGLDLPLWYAVVSDQYADERSIRDRIRDFKSDIARAQHRSGLPACCWLEILEGRPAVHSNILFPLGGPKAQRLIDGLLRSENFQGDELQHTQGQRRELVRALLLQRASDAGEIRRCRKARKKAPGITPARCGRGRSCSLVQSSQGPID